MAVRIYGKVLNTWKSENERGKMVVVQMEVEYKEYTTTGQLVGTGSEDFSVERYYSEEISSKQVWTWDGKKMNKGGKRWFDYHGYIRFNKSNKSQVMEYLKNKYSDAELVQLR